MGMFKEKEGIQRELETLKILGRWREDLWEERKGFGLKKKMRIGILRVNPIMEEDGEREKRSKPSSKRLPSDRKSVV